MHRFVILAEQGNVLQPDASAAVVFFTAIILAWLLNRILFNPINHVLDERLRRTHGYISEAKAMLAEYDRKVAQYETALRRARAETYALLEQRRRQALAHQARLLEAMKQEVADEIAHAREQIQKQVAQAKAELAEEARTMAHHLADTLLGRRIEEVTRIP